MIRRAFVKDLKGGRTDGVPQTYSMVRSGHNTEMDGDPQKKQALLINKGRQTRKQSDTEGKAAVKETKQESAKLKSKAYKR